MNDDQATLIRLYQYLLSKDVVIKGRIIDLRRNLQKKNPTSDDIYVLWYELTKVEIWEEFFSEVWNLLK